MRRAGHRPGARGDEAPAKRPYVDVLSGYAFTGELRERYYRDVKAAGLYLSGDGRTVRAPGLVLVKRLRRTSAPDSGTRQRGSYARLSMV